VATGLVTIYVILLTGQRALEAYRMRQQVEGVRLEIARLQGQNLAYQAELSGGKADEEIERIARQELGLVKPGDHPMALIWPTVQPSIAQSEPPPTPSAEPAWRALLREALGYAQRPR
jgi:hypothetical protein